MYGDIEAFIEDAPEPWFLWVLLVDTHHPWCAPPEYRKWDQPGFRGAHAWNYIMRRFPERTGRRRDTIVNAYDNEMRHADAFLERLDETLEANGYGDTAMVFHSDHGDELGEHGDYGHGNHWKYDTLTRVPLVMRNVGETGVVEGPTTLLDLGSTILDLAESEERLNDRPSLLNDERVSRDAIVVENRTADGGAKAAAIGHEWKVLTHGKGEREAYYRPDDELESQNRYGEHPDQLEAVLDAHLRERDGVSVNVENEGEIGDVQERLTNLGYIE